MKSVNILLIGLLFGAGVYSQPINDPNIQLRELKGFHAISVSGAFEVYLTQGNEEKVAVSAGEEKYLENILTQVKDGVLEITWKSTQKLELNRKLRAYISFTNMDILSAGGACDIQIVGTIKTGDLKIDLSGASDLLNGTLAAKRLSFKVSGASHAQIAGSAEQLDIDATGSSSFKGFNFSTDYCNATATGSSDISITVNKELSANATGSSDIHYKGAAVAREVRATGSSSISHKS